MLNAVDIEFVNLGIKISNLHQGFSLFGLNVAFYGVIIGLGLAAGTLLALWDAKQTGQNPDLYLDFVIYAIIFSVIGARLYYVIFDWDNYKDNLLEIFNIRGGGLAIYGGVIGAVLTLWVFTRVRKKSFFQMADTGVLGLLLGQVIGRWGNFVNCEAFGGYTDGPFAMRLNTELVNSYMITPELLEKSVIVDGIQYIQVHPTFLYESLWNLALLILLLCYRKHKRFEGEIFFLYLLGYGIGRAWIEGMRTDQLMLFHTGIAVSQALAVVLAVVSAGILVWKRKSGAVKSDE